LVSLACVLFLASWVTIHHGFYAKHRIIDTYVYQRYGDRMLRGRVPYKDFSIEYPPAALPVFVLPAVGNSKVLNPLVAARHRHSVRNAYRRNFERLMVLCGLALIALVAVALRGLRASKGKMAAALALAALYPLLLGPVIQSHFDLWPTMLALAALVAILTGRNRAGFTLLGVATAAKIFPVVLLPIGCIWVWKRAGKRELAACVAVFSAVIGACYLPFVIAAPHGVASSLSAQLQRPLQIESLGAATLMALHHLFGLTVTMQNGFRGFGGQSLVGSTAQIVERLQSALQIVALVFVWIWFSRGEANQERLIRASAAAIVAFVAFAKVLSPQFMIWICPFILLVCGRRGVAVSGIMALSFVLTQMFFPYHYRDYAFRFEVVPGTFVLLRDLALVGLFATLFAPIRERRRPVIGEGDPEMSDGVLRANRDIGWASGNYGARARYPSQRVDT
jgi:hypothetical protein